ncbi:MAG TPA: amino acid transporter [Devosia sp.]|nr:amino acid transporter [Devosia sp.]
MAGKLIENERVKLSATYLNSLAAAFFAAGVLAPVIGLFSASSVWQPLQLAAVVASCILLSVALHLAARLVLRGLAE